MIPPFVLLRSVMLSGAAPDGGDAGPVRIESRVAPTEASFGERLQLSVELRNTSEKPILFNARDANFIVEIESRAESRTIAIPQYTRKANSFKDDDIPLRPGDALTRYLAVQLNDLHTMPGE